MATTAPPTAAPPASAPITSAQPGGGFCMGLELAWGRFRRACLRRFRPGYVRRMAEIRQGHCPDCCHEVLDPRDLKFYRNVCGYSFRPEDDRFRWRDRLPVARAGWAELLVFGGLFLAPTVLFAVLALLVHPLLWLPAAVTGLGFVFVASFFRDPPRAIPTDADALLSPADGTITHIGEVEEPGIPGGRAFRISIFLSVFNVHVNRVPRSGRVVALRYFPGTFLDARRDDCHAQNEQLWIDLDDHGRLIRVKQIAGAVARRIVCWLRPGEEVRAGDKLGMIKFGSRTNIYLPLGEPVEMRVKIGDKVKGGSTVLLRFRSGAK